MLVAGQRQQPRKDATSGGSRPDRKARGKEDFESHCARCHGLDGRGGEHGPDISPTSAVQHLEDDGLFRIVHDGIPAKGMPSFDFLAAGQVRAVVSYLRSLGQPASRRPLRGNPARGEELFFGKAQCGGCHMISGRGGFVAADLTGYGESHASDEVREGILHPTRFHDRRQAVIEVVTRQGEHLSGVVRNEDNFSLQLLSADGTFRLLVKSEIERLNRSGSPIIAPDYAKTLSSGELDDLVSYMGQSYTVSHKGTGTQSHEKKQ